MSSLSEKHLQQIESIVRQHLHSYRCQVYIFGSRATGKAGRFSDVDIGIEADGPISDAVLARLETAFEESDLPFQVDLVNIEQTESKFKKLAKAKIIPLLDHS